MKRFKTRRKIQMSEPKITVVIPTRERCETLRSTIRTCVEQNYDNLEIIVSDNASMDETEAVVRSYSDPRLRYIKTQRRLSMTGNYEFALSHVRPGLVAILGDDDGLMPGAAAEAADLVGQTGAKAIVSYMIEYNWPSHQLESVRNRMYIRKISRRVRWRNSKNEMRKLLAFVQGGRRYNYWELPTIYRGFVTTEVIKAASYGGRYFHSMTPDVYAALVNSLLLDRFLRLDRPLFIEGISGRSVGASQAYGIDKTEEKRFVEENENPFHPDLVYAPSIRLIIAETYLQARFRFPELCNGYEFSLARVCAAAVRDAVGPNKDRIEQAVREVLAKHKLAATDSKMLSPSSFDIWEQRLEGLMGADVDCKRFGVDDVYQASVLAHHLLTLRHEGGMKSGPLLLLSKLRNKIGWHAGG
jgi:glycosyltransferase involved in cell wall biosynthesis